MTKTGVPLTPEEMREHASPIPGAVFDVFNALLAIGAGIRPVTIMQPEVEHKLRQHNIDIKEAFEKHWLDVEAAYEAAGWTVKYDKPGYNESYEPSWTFTPKRMAR